MDKNSPQTTTKRPILSLKSRPKGNTCTLSAPTPHTKPVTHPEPKGSDTVANQLAEWLSQQSNTWRNQHPLKLGIIQDIYVLLGDNSPYSKRVIHKTLRWHTSRTQYLRNVLQHSQRYGLDGQAAGEVTATQRLHAKNELNKRYQKPGQ
ncbi:ProQ/FinO family protein [Thiothrix winogradskyi]|uniref:ProQ/FinO family protein n=1 Tax=Thiothrix winogradskyi TaxID=96472 RepID=A0ABY3T379_9GAMM|nr:ProQ/FinO family protein [Thiothrix winogradskyi]UJS26297.1 ProQ/FinO family protein [Thiothrix winogradskyi]